MKRLAYLLIIICVVALSVPAFSMEFIIGMRGGYFVWDPWIKDVGQQFKEMNTGSGALYGPVGSVLLTEDLSISVSGLIGTQNGSGLSNNIPRDVDRFQNIKFSFETLRVDIDSALSYRVGENVKIFAGYKYLYLETEYTAISHVFDPTVPPPYPLKEVRQEDLTILQPFNGPALGLGFSLPLGGRGFFIAANISFLYMWGRFEADGGQTIQYDQGTGYVYLTDTGFDAKLDMRMYGVNVEPTIGLNPGEGMPILTLGVRYQLNRLKINDTEKAEFYEMETDWMTDQIYGVFVGVLYQI